MTSSSSRPVTCRACRAPIYFVRTPAGKLMPIDVTTVRRGGKPVLWLDNGDGRASQAFPGVDGITEGHESHFATCPAAGRFRKRA